VKLAGVATDVMGQSGRAILAALVAGTDDPVAMAALARGKLRAKRPALVRALAGRVRDHHRRLLALHLSHVDVLDEAIAELDAEVAERTRPVQAELARLDTIPGVDRRIAAVLVAEGGGAISIPRQCPCGTRSEAGAGRGGGR
jgi:transposase